VAARWQAGARLRVAVNACGSVSVRAGKCGGVRGERYRSEKKTVRGARAARQPRGVGLGGGAGWGGGHVRWNATPMPPPEPLTIPSSQ